jgi:5-methylcytosine-specific restriction endonuclease McrA
MDKNKVKKGDMVQCPDCLDFFRADHHLNKRCNDCRVAYKNEQKQNWRDSHKKYMADYHKRRQSKNGVGFAKKRWQVLQRDNFTCQYCGRSPSKDGVVLEVDHLKPRNGDCRVDAPLNELITACRQCNIGKFNSHLSSEQLDYFKKKDR